MCGLAYKNYILKCGTVLNLSYQCFKVNDWGKRDREKGGVAKCEWKSENVV